MGEVFYRKVGKRYIPVAESDVMSRGMPSGCYLVIVQPGLQTYRICLNPEYANFVAAMEQFKDDLKSRLVHLISQGNMSVNDIVDRAMDDFIDRYVIDRDS